MVFTRLCQASGPADHKIAKVRRFNKKKYSDVNAQGLQVMNLCNWAHCSGLCCNRLSRFSVEKILSRTVSSEEEHDHVEEWVQLSTEAACHQNKLMSAQNNTSDQAKTANSLYETQEMVGQEQYGG